MTQPHTTTWMNGFIFKTRQNYSMLSEVRIMVFCGEERGGRDGGMKGSCVLGRVLCSDLGDDYMSVLTLG